MNEQSNSKKVRLWITSVVALALAGLGIVFASKKPADNATIDNAVATTTTDAISPNTDSSGKSANDVALAPVKKTFSYKNGVYSAEGEYESPAGLDKINVTIKLTNDIVTYATVLPEAEAPQSKEYQAKFISGFKEFVIGRKIDNINLTKVSGSSLTPKGWNDALDKIKMEAKS